ncbi:MAG: PolC-type DNA polymerase III [Bacilli bacterium]|nr:PolC-type DNA polymerase III [Bacilli bacterium]
MNDALTRFFNSINFTPTILEDFNNVSIEKVVLNKKSESFNVFIKCKNLVNLKDMKKLVSCASKGINGEKKCIINFSYENVTDDDINNYVSNIITELAKKRPSLVSLQNSAIEKDGEIIIIEVSSKVEEEEINKEAKKISNDLSSFGLKDLIITTRLNDEKRSEIIGEINKSKEEVVIDNKKEEENNIIYGRHKDGEISEINSLMGEVKNVIVEAYVFGTDFVERQGQKGPIFIMNFKLSDRTNSILAKLLRFDEEEFKFISKNIKEGSWYRFYGDIQNDTYLKDLVLNIKSIEKIKSKDSTREDNAPVKRVELHAHTMMSQMDGITRLDLGKHTCELVSRCIAMGYKGVAITDHNGCQAFPIAYQIINGYNKKQEDPSKKFKGLYGTELMIVDDTTSIVKDPTDEKLEGNTFVVFDTETTGFNAAGGDQMIEIGAVKIKDGAIIDRFDKFINPGYHIPDNITQLTEITDEMVKDADDEKTVTLEFLEWAGNNPMVAHNAKFDISFIQMAMKKNDLGLFKSTVIDTLELSRQLDQGFARHSLSALVKRYNVPFDEDAHHRADYDAEGTALVFDKMLKKLLQQNIETIKDIDTKLVSKEEIHKFGRTFHFNAIALNRNGLKNLFKIISLANTKYFYKTPRIPRSVLNELRDGLVIGSGCYESEVFIEARSKDSSDLANIINFYDYVEVQPPEVYNHLIQTSDFKDEYELENHIRKIINETKKNGKLIVATGDVHHFDREDKIYREIIINQKVPGGGRHPLAKKDIVNIPSQHFRTTEEMLEDFAFLNNDELIKEIVIDNTNKILDMVQEIEVIIDTHGVPFSPRVRSDDGETYLDCKRVVTDLVYNKAESWYGSPLPYNIEERIAKELYGDVVYNYWHEKIDKSNPNISNEELERLTFENVHNSIVTGYDEIHKLVEELVISKWLPEDGEQSQEAVEKKIKKSLGGIIGGGFDPIYLIAQRLVKHSNDDGYIVGSRGSVGSSFVATLMGITEVNPLPAHYRCLKCQHSIFNDENGVPYGKNYSSGFDLPDMVCPKCGEPMKKDGQDMPFATFLGFNADKVPDIDLNFSDLNQASAHEYTKVLFGVDNVYRAGTIGTVADKTAFGFVKGYFEDRGILSTRNIEIERLALGCTGVKRTTGQHPGGIVVVPDYKEVYDFTPYQYPAEDPTSAWRTTHFDYHSIEEDLLKLDILGHSDPTQLKLIQDLSKTDVNKVPFDDKETMSIFSSTEALKVTNEEIMCPTGTLGIPEFGTSFTIGMVDEIKPTHFSELVKIAGLSHGTDVWLGNAQELIKNNVVPFTEVIGCRDDIMVYLIYHGVVPIKAFKIMEFVRKGKASKDPATWAEHKQTMIDANIPDWFINSCQKIKYMFPKAHAAAYVMSAFRIAWYKVHMPAYFYASWYSTKATAFDIEAMIGGYDKIKNKLIEIKNKGYDATNKEVGASESLNVALEMAARGINVAPFDLYKSKGLTFDVEDEHTLIPPFITIDGLGETVAMNIEKEAKRAPFISIEDFQTRCKVSQTLIDKMTGMGIFKGMPESSQLSLF